MTDLPRISVVLPSYNQGKFLEDCLLSILGQNYPELEVLVCDGGSTDESVEIIKRYESRLAFWRSERDGGQSSAINDGMRRSTGEILCWLNSDDMFMPGALLHVGRALRDRVKEPWLLYGATIILDEREAVPTASCDPSMPFDAEALTHYAFVTQPSSFWTRAIWAAAGELDPAWHFVMDWEWFERASRVGRFEHSARAFSIYRRHPEHKSGQSSARRRQEVCKVVRERASAYWGDLFGDVESRFDALRGRAEFLERWRLPGRRKLLPFLAPRFLPRLRRLEDLSTALNMQR